MKKFKFRLDTLIKQRKVEQDIAQREYAEAQSVLNEQLARIDFFYNEIDDARIESETLQLQGGTCQSKLEMIEGFIEGQKTRIFYARQKARELMQVAEEKHEILVEKMRQYKVLDKLKEKQAAAHHKERNRKLQKEADDMTIMRINLEDRA